MNILAQSRLLKQSKTRLAVALAVLGGCGMMAAFGTVPDSALPLSTRTVVEALAPKPVESNSGQVYWREERFQRGDTFAALLDRLGVDGNQSTRVLRSPEALRPLSQLRTGTTVQAQTDQDGVLVSLRFVSARDQVLGFDREGGTFRSVELSGALDREVQMKSGEISSSLFAATDAAGLPDGIAIQLADIFGGDVDFNRGLRSGDRFSVVYEMLVHDGRPIHSGRVLAAEFTNGKRIYRAVWFDNSDGKTGYYTPDGNNLRKTFLRSPLEFSRITSGYSMRFHPILHQWRAHKGIDFGAPVGTRVRATGDGLVESAGQKSGYGNVVILRHNGSYATYYAHLSRLAPGVRRGTRVAQGDVIGYVGQTGWATGPHLHYEFRVHNEHRNPLTIALPAALPIAPQRMAAFQTMAGPLVARLDLLRNTNLALLE